MSFDEPPYADLLDPPVTSLDRHDRQLGRRAAELLLDALADGGAASAAPVSSACRSRCGPPLVRLRG